MEIEKIYNSRLNETIYKKVHESGFEMYFVPKRDFQKKYAYFVTKYGAFSNEFEVEKKKYSMPEGIAHFLEHKLFENSEINIFEEFSKKGADLNAFTSYEMTSYYFSTVEKFHELLKLLMNFVQNPYLTDENVEKEKDIIVQEINMYNDDPHWRLYFNSFKAMYHNFPIKFDIAGTEETVRSITKEDLELCYKFFYSPKNTFIFVIGDLEVEDVFKNIEESLTEKFLEKKYDPKVYFKEEPIEVSKKEIITFDKDVSVPSVYLSFKGLGGINLSPRAVVKKYFALKIALELLVGSSSKLSEKFFNEDILSSSLNFDYTFEKNYSYIMILVETEHIELFVEEVVKTFKNKNKDTFKLKDFTRIKKKLTGRNIVAFNSLQNMSMKFIRTIPKGVNIMDYIDIIEEIQIEDLVSVLDEYFDFDNYVISKLLKSE